MHALRFEGALRQAWRRAAALRCCPLHCALRRAAWGHVRMQYSAAMRVPLRGAEASLAWQSARGRFNGSPLAHLILPRCAHCAAMRGLHWDVVVSQRVAPRAAALQVPRCVTRMSCEELC